MIRILLLALGLLVLAVGGIVLVGFLAPLRHLSRTATSLPRSPADVWALVGDIGSWPSWNPGITELKRLPDRDGRPVWSMKWKGGELPAEIMEVRPPDGPRAGRLVTRIADDRLPFGGTWTWEIAAEGAGTRVSITEDGEIRSALFRGVSRLFLGYTGTQRAYLQALAAGLGSPSPAFEEQVSHR